ncbi:MAG: hypothetical protein IIY70_04565 [Oscillospiraceae bacterium]|nr:hypothetical protein [Oscillospiraceae bacterium]
MPANGENTVLGTGMLPQAGAVYYLKEVPDSYLANRTVAVYNKNTFEISRIYLLSVTDDSAYKRIDYKLLQNPSQTGDDLLQALTESETVVSGMLSGTFVVNIRGEDPSRYTSEYFDCPAGGIVSVIDLMTGALDASTVYAARPCWTTFDGVEVFGYTGVQVTTNAEKTWNAEWISYLEPTPKP